jgi:hypothetical protein
MSINESGFLNEGMRARTNRASSPMLTPNSHALGRRENIIIADFEDLPHNSCSSPPSYGPETVRRRHGRTWLA